MSANREAKFFDVSSSTGTFKIPTFDDAVPVKEEVEVQTYDTKETAATAGRRKSLEAAVYSHIKAIRALGRTDVNTTEIASALGLTVAEVESTLAALQKKGVKVVA